MTNEQNNSNGELGDIMSVSPDHSWERSRRDIEDFAEPPVEGISGMSPEEVRLHLRRANIDVTWHQAALRQRLASLRAGSTPPPYGAASNRQTTVHNRWFSPVEADVKEQAAEAYRLLEKEYSSLLASDPVSALGQALGMSAHSIVAMNRDTGRRDRFTTETVSLEGAAKTQDFEREKWIQGEAEAILRSTNCLYPPIHKHFDTLTDRFSLLYKEVRQPKSTLEGATIVDGRKGAIFINRSVQQAERRHFTWAHEFGHYILHSDLGLHTFHDSYSDLHRFGDLFEYEANIFASALLLPESHLSTIHRPDNIPRLAAVNAVIHMFKVSALAALYRVTRSTEHPCVLLVFRDGALNWHFPSQAFEGTIMREKSAPPAGSTTSLYTAEASNAQNKFFRPGTPAEWWITEGNYSYADESTYNVNPHYVYTLLNFHG